MARARTLELASKHTTTQQLRVHLLTYADSAALPAFVPRTPLLLSASRAPIDRYFLPSGPTRNALSRSGFAAVGPCWDRRTDARQLHTPCFAYYAGSAN